MTTDRANRGYVRWSMSERAAAAYDDGALPLSKIDSYWLNQHGINCSRAELRDLVAANDVPGFSCGVRASEWHHTSKFFNETSFYRPEDVRNQVNPLGGTLIGEIRAAVKMYRKAADTDGRRTAIDALTDLDRQARDLQVAAAEAREASVVERFHAAAADKHFRNLWSSTDSSLTHDEVLEELLEASEAEIETALAGLSSGALRILDSVEIVEAAEERERQIEQHPGQLENRLAGRRLQRRDPYRYEWTDEDTHDDAVAILSRELVDIAELLAVVEAGGTFKFRAMGCEEIRLRPQAGDGAA